MFQFHENFCPVALLTPIPAHHVTRNKAFVFQKMYLQVVYLCKYLLRCAGPGLSCPSLHFCTFSHTTYNQSQVLLQPLHLSWRWQIYLSPSFTEHVVCGLQYLYILLVWGVLLGGKVRNTNLYPVLPGSHHFIPKSLYITCLMTSYLKSAKEQ